MPQSPNLPLNDLLAARFMDAPACPASVSDNETLNKMAARGSCRDFLDRPLPTALLQTLSAVALAAPSKSDLQQRDIIIVSNPAKRQRLANLVSGQAWVADAPALMVFCGNNRRQRLLHEHRAIPFANDHLDAFFNAAVDGAIALGAFVTAAEVAGLGCCPISAIRNEAAAVSDLLALPDHVFPIAGLAVGYPAGAPVISKRLPLGATVQIDHYSEDDIHNAIAAYDQDRAAIQPYAKQREVARFGASENYGWSEDKLRQYSRPERADFGTYIRAKGFRLE